MDKKLCILIDGSDMSDGVINSLIDNVHGDKYIYFPYSNKERARAIKLSSDNGKVQVMVLPESQDEQAQLSLEIAYTLGSFCESMIDTNFVVVSHCEKLKGLVESISIPFKVIECIDMWVYSLEWTLLNWLGIRDSNSIDMDSALHHFKFEDLRGAIKGLNALNLVQLKVNSDLTTSILWDPDIIQNITQSEDAK